MRTGRPGTRASRLPQQNTGILSFDSAQDRLLPLAPQNDDFPIFITCLDGILASQKKTAELSVTFSSRPAIATQSVTFAASP